MKHLKRRIIIVTSATILAAFIFLFLLRDNFITQAAFKKTDHFNKTHNAKFAYKNIYFKGLKSIQIDSLYVTTASNDTLLFLGSLFAEINLGQIITGHIAFSKLYIENGKIAVDESKIGDYVNDFAKTDSIHKRVLSVTRYNKNIERLLNRVFKTLPKDLMVKNFSIFYLQNPFSIGANIDLLELKKEKLAATIKLIRNNQAQMAFVEGTVAPRKGAIEILVQAQEKEAMLNSPLAELFDAEVKYKSLKFGFIVKENYDNTFRFEGNFAAGQFDVNYKPLSSKNIRVPGFSTKFNFSVGENYIELDSISELTMGTLKLNPYLKYSRGNGDSITFSFSIPAFTTNDFFTSLPPELFPNIKYFEADGDLRYRTKVIVNLNQPDSLRFESHLNADNFRINHLNSELSKMDTGFVYTAFEMGNPMRTIIVGPENPDFISLDQIPLFLQNCILAAEDIEFYKHNGFLTESIRHALAQNIKEKKFKRGGSTISQQLVKNVYLSREKTLSRKFEEIVLVWLIESNRLVSKSRMFEVYLNIIEWGPNVYGVNEAAMFYFNKNATQLNESECIFLASVIPSPKKFFLRFDKQGELAPFMIQYYNDMSGKLFRWQLLDTANGDSLSSHLKITGPAKDLLRIDTVLIDSIQTPILIDEE